MDKETLLSKLKATIGEPNASTQMYEKIGISVRTLESYADMILPGITDDAQVTDDYVSGHVNMLKAMGGQMNHEKAEFIKNYKPNTPPTPPATPSGENDELKALKESLEEIKSQLKGAQHEKNANALRNEVKGKSKALKVQNQALWDDVVNSTNITDGMDTAALETAVKSAYEAKLKAYFGDGASPYGGKGDGGSSEEHVKDARNAFKERMRQRGKLPKKQE